MVIHHQGNNAKGHLHPVPNAGLPPEAATVIEVIIIDHFDVAAAAAVVGSLSDDVGFGDDPRFWTRLGVLLLVREKRTEAFTKAYFINDLWSMTGRHF